MVQYQLKLRLNRAQERTLEEWLWRLTGVWNWAVRKIELDARDGIFHSEFELYNATAGCSKHLGVPSNSIQGMIARAHRTWQRCFQRKGGRPHLKGRRNRLNSIPFPHSFQLDGNKVRIPKIGWTRFNKQALPAGKIKQGQIVRRASGWFLCLTIDADPRPIPHLADGRIGIDPGFKHLLTLSTGEKIEHPRELEADARRLAQAQRGGNKRLVARLQERTANRRKDRNHKLSQRLVAENSFIAFSKDNIKGMQRTFGKSVQSSSHFQLRSMLSYKCRPGDGRVFVEVPSRNSTKCCSDCGSLSGPSGWSDLSVRQWECTGCGARHDRDINAARNVLKAGLGLSHEGGREASSETPS